MYRRDHSRKPLRTSTNEDVFHFLMVCQIQTSALCMRNQRQERVVTTLGLCGTGQTYAHSHPENLRPFRLLPIFLNVLERFVLEDFYYQIRSDQYGYRLGILPPST
ncbi:hypothetical protein J6590_045125 [Homalodisca vitripennis]|nr:hypothetical protein J6590_045125 [Homalodisca vitripennis]